MKKDTEKQVQADSNEPFLQDLCSHQEKVDLMMKKEIEKGNGTKEIGQETDESSESGK